MSFSSKPCIDLRWRQVLYVPKSGSFCLLTDRRWRHKESDGFRPGLLGRRNRARNAYANRSKRKTDCKDSGRGTCTPGCVTSWGANVHRKREPLWCPWLDQAAVAARGARAAELSRDRSPCPSTGRIL